MLNRTYDSVLDEAKLRWKLERVRIVCSIEAQEFDREFDLNIEQRYWTLDAKTGEAYLLRRYLSTEEPEEAASERRLEARLEASSSQVEALLALWERAGPRAPSPEPLREPPMVGRAATEGALSPPALVRRPSRSPARRRQKSAPNLGQGRK